MSTEQRLDYLGNGYAVFLFVLPPLLVILPVWIFHWRSRLFRFCLATFIPWFGIGAYHSFVIAPLSFRAARGRGDELYDGVGANAAVTFMGFVIPALIASIVLAIEFLIRRARRTHASAVK